MEKYRIFVLGGDGFCGWPISLYLAKFGHEICILDNLSRRRIDKELGIQSLTPISDINTRIKFSNRNIKFHEVDVAQDYYKMFSSILTYKPDVIIHLAEQRAAPYSMKNEGCKRYTVDNNINATNNVLCAIVESGLDIHLIHIGTMGVYGYGAIDAPIPEGYLDVFMKDGKGEIIEKSIYYPANPGSIYHMTKVMDAQLFHYYNKNNNLRITDLHQGIIWGTNTEETLVNEKLMNRFDYDGDYGTVLNRFLMQAAIGYPLTVHGTGGQTRAFIHIRDTVKCIKIAVDNPPRKKDRVKIFNQATEAHRIITLAKTVSDLTGVEIMLQKNPRKEDAENNLSFINEKFLKLGLKPTRLKDELMFEIRDVAKKYAARCDKKKIPCNSFWVR